MEKQEDQIEAVLDTFSNSVSEQERKLWVQQYAAKYCKAECDLLLEEEAQLDKGIMEEEKKLKKLEKKIPEVKETKEGLMSSTTTTKNVIKHLLERLSDARQDENNWQNKLREKEQEMEKIINEERRKRESGNGLYKQVQEKRNACKGMKIHYAMLLKEEEVKKQQLKMRLQINQQLFCSKIVEFVQRLTNYNRMIQLNKEIAAAKAALNAMTLKLIEPSQINVPTYQRNIPREFFDPPILPPWTMVNPPQPKAVTTNNHQDDNDLKELQQRSILRKRKFLQLLDSPLNITNASQLRKDEIAEDKYVKKTIATSIIPDNPKRKIKLLENIVVSKPAAQEQNLSFSKKLEHTKAKKVSFGKPLPQDKENVPWSNNKDEHQQSFNSSDPIAPVEDNVSKVFQKPDDNIFNETEINRSIGYSFISPEYCPDTSYGHLNKSVDQTLRDDFFVTPQPSSSGRPSIFGNFRFSDTHEEASGNQFSFF